MLQLCTLYLLPLRAKNLNLMSLGNTKGKIAFFDLLGEIIGYHITESIINHGLPRRLCQISRTDEGLAIFIDSWKGSSWFGSLPFHYVAHSNKWTPTSSCQHFSSQRIVIVWLPMGTNKQFPHQDILLLLLRAFTYLEFNLTQVSISMR